jgi:hypothetical protein
MFAARDAIRQLPLQVGTLSLRSKTEGKEEPMEYKSITGIVQ